MKFNKAQLHVLFRALTNAIEWQDTLPDTFRGSKSDLKWFQQTKNESLIYSNMREQIGRVLRGESK
jgi:hypothetical protein